MSWDTKRQKPYTTEGIKRLRCIRCGDPAIHQWQICSDGNNYRPICLGCDFALNQLVLQFFKHPKTAELMDAYIVNGGAGGRPT